MEEMRYESHYEVGEREAEEARRKSHAKGCLVGGCFAFIFLLLCANLVIVSQVQRNTESHPTEKCVPQNTVCVDSCSRVCIGLPDCFTKCLSDCQSPTAPASPSDVGGMLRLGALHHIGITVSNLTRSIEFYTEVLGGALVPNAGGPGWNGDSVKQLLFQVEVLEAKEKGVSQESLAIAQIQTNGTDTLDAAYVNFGAIQVELLEYRQKAGNQNSVPYKQQWSSPSVTNHMHACFHVSESVDLNVFIHELETKAAARGMTEVRCNRIIAVNSEAERKALGSKLIYNSYAVKSGKFRGWNLAYCKGVEGEQLEFSQEKYAAGTDFDDALLAYLRSKPANA